MFMRLILNFVMLCSISVAKLAINLLHNHISLLKATCLKCDLLTYFNGNNCFQKCKTRARKLGILIMDDTKDGRDMSNESLNQNFENIQVSVCHELPCISI